MQYRECPNCGASLDPGERCDCRSEKPAQLIGREFFAASASTRSAETQRKEPARCY